MVSSLCTESRGTLTGAHAAPGAGMRRHRPPARASALGRWRPRALRAHASATEPEPLAPAKGGQPAVPWTALRVGAGAGVALALALGGASWSARGGGAGAVLVQPAMVYTLNAVTDGTERGGTPAAAVRTSVGALSDSLFRREDAPRENATLMDLVFEQVTKEHIGDRGKLTSLLQKEWAASRDPERKLDLGLLLTDVLINQREWQRAKEVCQQLTGRYQRDSRPYLHLAVVNMMMAVETMLSPDTATADDIEKMSKNAMDAWKEFKNKYELAKGTTESST
ncbi:uncharacterized protein LOC119281089 [Triticum dicoccoides]|uniref:uncharacterized protein LOC119281089 n=1 Tax=Triticum dicoccoides TaxID=85692 RepID=UPI00188DEE47|nr:uncharacterized protein LOC119281089 [Triticum dicoccoides]